MSTDPNRHIPEYGVFIVESMDIENEQDGHLNGKVLSKILDLCDIPCKYFYIRTRTELKEIIKLFGDCDFGFIHFCCHANNTGLEFTYDFVSFAELEAIIGPYMKYRRLFLSACEAAVFDLAKHFIPKHHTYSVIGTPDAITYDKAAIFWSSFYYLMYETDQRQMWQKYLIPTLTTITQTFNFKLNYFSIIQERHQKSKTHLKEFHFDSGKIVFERIADTGFHNIHRDPPGVNDPHMINLTLRFDNS